MSENPQAPMKFAMRCKQFFGSKPGQTLNEFASEINTLTDKDKVELVAEFNKAGLPTDTPTLKGDGSIQS